jgi:hypothetical protein
MTHHRNTRSGPRDVRFESRPPQTRRADSGAFFVGLVAMLLLTATPAFAKGPGSGPADSPVAGIVLDASGREKYDTGWAFYFDNDALTPAERDEDYTGGMALTLSGRRAQESLVSVDTPLAWLDKMVLGTRLDDTHQLHSLQVGAIAFTPGDIQLDAVTPGDRPYASLLYVANGRSYVRGADSTVYHSSFSVGVLGTRAVPEFQDQFHGAIGAQKPKGWDHQISDGGEPTFRYTVTRQDLQRAANTGASTRYEIKSAVAGSVGYLTEASTALSIRWGRINTPWWSGPPDRVEYIAEPAPATGGSVMRSDIKELYVWAGIKAHVRAYNAFLQGQFRHSDLEYDYSDTRPLIAEAWAGVTAQIVGEYRVSWVMRLQSSELRDGPGDRSLLWGGLVVSHDI